MTPLDQCATIGGGPIPRQSLIYSTLDQRIVSAWRQGRLRDSTPCASVCVWGGGERGVMTPSNSCSTWGCLGGGSARQEDHNRERDYYCYYYYYCTHALAQELTSCLSYNPTRLVGAASTTARCEVVAPPATTLGDFVVDSAAVARGARLDQSLDVWPANFSPPRSS